MSNINPKKLTQVLKESIVGGAKTYKNLKFEVESISLILESILNSIGSLVKAIELNSAEIKQNKQDIKEMRDVIIRVVKKDGGASSSIELPMPKIKPGSDKPN